MSRSFLLSCLLIILIVRNTQSFAVVNNIGRFESTSASKCSSTHLLRNVDARVFRSLKSSQQDEDGVITTGTGEEKGTQEPEPEYPLDLPSPILLGSSMVIAIASTGEG